MAMVEEQGIDVEANPVIKFMRRLLPVTNRYHGQSFFVRERAATGGEAARRDAAVRRAGDGRDDRLIFAVDSIPAIFAVTTDPFLVYTSNVCAILGLRSLYFLLAGIVDKFRFLQLGLSMVLVFVGGKMLLADIYKVPSASRSASSREF